jgi:hypothetical protein
VSPRIHAWVVLDRRGCEPVGYRTEEEARGHAEGFDEMDTDAAPHRVCVAVDPDDVAEARRLMADFIDGEVCNFEYMRREGETCREARTRQQGVPCVGCPQCEARAFLRRTSDMGTP